MTDRKTRRLAADPAGVAQAAEILRAGGLVAFPTETVYGLGADATNPRAVAAIYEAKGRPRFNPLIAHVSSFEQARREGRFSPLAEKLAQKFWPGPLTLVVPLADTATVCDLARAGLPSLGLRMPAQSIARDLIARAQKPIAAPSANRSGHVSPVTADHVLADLDHRIDAVVDGGPCAVGVESSIVAMLDARPTLLRPGGLLRADLEAVLGAELADARPDETQPLAPGLLASHYAPGASVRLEAQTLEPGEAGLDFAGRFSGAESCLDLSPSGDLAEAAVNLFSYLRALDAGGARAIAVAPIPRRGLGEAINDRLARAAAPRP
jgi:L-threonylcarbamoyladenylate synthase